MAAHAFAAIEYLLEETYLPAKWLAYKHSPVLAGIGEHPTDVEYRVSHTNILTYSCSQQV